MSLGMIETRQWKRSYEAERVRRWQKGESKCMNEALTFVTFFGISQYSYCTLKL
jgi:hypothetical protein